MRFDSHKVLQATRFDPSKMDIFRRQRKTDCGAKGAGKRFFDPVFFERGYKPVKDARQTRAALAQFFGVQRQIAAQAIRITTRTNGFISRDALISATYALISAKNPSVKETDVLRVICTLGLNKGLTRVHKKIPTAVSKT